MSLPDKDAGSTYGALNKLDYQSLPPADPITDWSNPLIAPAFCNVAGATQTLPRAYLSATLNASDGYIVLNNFGAVWINITTTAPVCHHVSTGIFTFTWPTVVSDEYNASFGIYNNHTVNFTKGFGNLENPGELSSVHVSATANVITVKLFNHSNALSDFSGKTLDIWGCY
jgi:hypothetical protein